MSVLVVLKQFPMRKQRKKRLCNSASEDSLHEKEIVPFSLEKVLTDQVSSLSRVVPFRNVQGEKGLVDPCSPAPYKERFPE